MFKKICFKFPKCKLGKPTIKLSPNVRRDILEGCKVMFDLSYSSVTTWLTLSLAIFEPPFVTKQSPPTSAIRSNFEDQKQLLGPF